MPAHPKDVLLGAQAGAFLLPAVDHYSGVEVRMRKSLALQREMSRELGACVFDVTLDCEDGAAVGAEAAHARLVNQLVDEAFAAHAQDGPGAAAPRVAVRVHAVDHPAFESDVQIVVGASAHRLAHVMLPKVEQLADVERAVRAIDAAAAQAPLREASREPSHEGGVPVHVLLESPAAVHRAFDIAAHPRVQSVSFGLMDFVSAHGGAIPSQGMGVQGQFSHPLVVRAKLEIAAACHAHGKVPSHCVVTEFNDAQAVQQAARQAAQAFGYTRMWSIHPSQIRPILDALAPTDAEISLASKVLDSAMRADWAPIRFDNQLHDRASYRYFWQVLQRAHATGRRLPGEAAALFH